MIRKINNRKAYSRLHFEVHSRAGLLKFKRSQTEVIVTVLLILVGIVAVGFLSAWIINLVKGNLKSTACFDIAGQISLDMGNTFLVEGTSNLDYMHSDWLYLGLQRSGKDFNLTGFNVVYGNDFATDRKLKIASSSVTRVYLVNSTGKPGSSNLIFPDSGEERTYAINITAFGIDNINKVSIYPIIEGTLECEKADEQSVSLKA